MQQYLATPSLHLWFLGVAEDFCMFSVVPSCIYSFGHGVIPTSYFIFTLVSQICKINGANNTKHSSSLQAGSGVEPSSEMNCSKSTTSIITGAVIAVSGIVVGCIVSTCGLIIAYYVTTKR